MSFIDNLVKIEHIKTGIEKDFGMYDLSEILDSNVVDYIYNFITSELNTVRCTNCKYLNKNSEDNSCNNDVMKTYYGISFDVDDFFCEKYKRGIL
jgi:hypothetical protein